MRSKKSSPQKKVPEHLRMEMAANIMAIREKRKMSLGAVGRAIGKTTNTIIDYENAKISPSLLGLYQLAEGLRVSPRELLWED